MATQFPNDIPVVSPVGTKIVEETIANLTRKGGTMMLGDAFSGIVDHALAMAQRDAEQGRRVIMFGTSDLMFALDRRYNTNSTVEFSIFGHRVHDYSIEASDGDILGAMLASTRENVIVDFSAMSPRSAAHFLRRAMEHVVEQGRDFSGAQLYLIGLDDFLSRKRHYDGPAVVAIRTLMIRHALRVALHTTSASWEDVPLEFRKYLPNILVGHTPNREDIKSLAQSLDGRILMAHHFIGGFQRLGEGHAFVWPRADNGLVEGEPYYVAPSPKLKLSGGNDYHSRKKARDSEKDAISDMKAAKAERETKKADTKGSAKSAKRAPVYADGSRKGAIPESQAGLAAFLAQAGVPSYSHSANIANAVLRYDRHGDICSKTPVAYEDALEIAISPEANHIASIRWINNKAGDTLRSLLGFTSGCVAHILLLRTAGGADAVSDALTQGSDASSRAASRPPRRRHQAQPGRHRHRPVACRRRREEGRGERRGGARQRLIRRRKNAMAVTSPK